MNVVKKLFQYGEHTVTLETGIIARQATGSVVVTMGDTKVLVTVVCKKDDDGASRDFFPLTVHYVEKSYAAGRIPGGYFKREGRPSEREVLISRLIDRPIRPLFPEGFKSEIQVVATVLSVDPAVDTDIPSLIGASAALMLTGAPFMGPIAAARVGYANGQYLLNPSKEQINTSELDLVVAGAKDAILMVESEAKELSEKVMLDAVLFGHQHMQVAIKAIEEFVKDAGTTSWGWKDTPRDETLVSSLKSQYEAEIAAAYRIQEKMERHDKISAIYKTALEKFINEEANNASLIENILSNIESSVVRERILANEPRIDGRDLKTVRPITIHTGYLPRAHGSAVFTRGETQAIVAATLGTDRDGQIIDGLDGEKRETFMLHYNFPPYCVGETGMMGSPKRREVGHGNLARRAISPMLPSQESFPYVIRVVSEITESNGSSSMATVCGTSLALMDTGVPLKAPVAGIAMGLVKEGDRFAVISDILGDEDHLGDMDFKVAGSAKGVTALQMDIKISGITQEIMQKALTQAQEGRMHILQKMNAALENPREEMSLHAPRILSMNVPVDKIRDVIGKGGVTIRGLIDELGVNIDIDDSGLVKIFSADGEAAKEAQRRIERITADVEIGKIYDGTVTKIMDFGAFVAFLPGKEGLVHISQICDKRVENVTDELSEGQHVRVKVLEIDKQGRVRLSMRAVAEEEAQ